MKLEKTNCFICNSDKYETPLFKSKFKEFNMDFNVVKCKRCDLVYVNPRPSEKDMHTFQEYLTKRGLHCTIRESKGLDISAACGQLREQELEGEM